MKQWGIDRRWILPGKIDSLIDSASFKQLDMRGENCVCVRRLYSPKVEIMIDILRIYALG